MDFETENYGMESANSNRCSANEAIGAILMTVKPPLSHIRFAGSTAYISGQLPRGTDGKIIAGDMRDQTRQSLRNLQAVLTSEGLELSDVVKVTAWITDADFVADFNLVYREYFSEPFPARSTLVSALVVPGAMVEIDAIAYRDRK
jgi:2-iminobutanoate/2-iminopropanoate deaminase